MFWFLLCAIVGSTIAFGYVAWRNWIAPWRKIERLVRQIAGGERPRTFLIEGGKDAQRAGLALENLFARQQELDQQISKNTTGSGTIFGAMQDGFLLVDAERRIALLNRAFQDLFEIRDDSLGAPLIEVIRDVSIEQMLDQTLRKREALRREIIVADRQMEMNSVPMRNNKGEITGAAVLFLPPYSPDLNPDEFVWSHMKKNGVSKNPLKKNESLRQRVEEDLVAIYNNRELVRSFFCAESVVYAKD